MSTPSGSNERNIESEAAGSTTPPRVTALTPLDTVEQKFTLLRDRARAVAQGYDTGLLVYGRGGIGKSHHVIDELTSCGRSFHHFNGKLTPRGLFDALAAHPDDLHVFEDVDRLWKDSHAASVLRAALWGTPSETDPTVGTRTIRWVTHQGAESAVFTGGIILIGNAPFPENPEFKAVQTRVSSIDFNFSPDEVYALMRQVSRAGYSHEGQRLEPEECLEVCAFLIQVCCENDKNPDLRLLFGAFADFAFYSAGGSDSRWKELVTARVTRLPAIRHAGVRRGARTSQRTNELQLVLSLQSLSEPRERVSRWKETTQKSQSSYYRVLEEAQAAMAERTSGTEPQHAGSSQSVDRAHSPASSDSQSASIATPAETPSSVTPGSLDSPATGESSVDVA